MKSDNLIKGSTNSIIFSYKVEEQEQKDDEMMNQIIFKKYKIKNKNCKASTIDIYDGIEIESNKPVLIKIENKSKEKLYLEEEAYNLYSFKGFGIPELIKIGKRKNNIIIIESKKGRSLSELFTENNKKFSINEICLIGIQCIERLKWVHSKHYIHRNIKPENFVIGLEDPHIIYLQNFYFCQKYRSSKTHQHIRFKYIKEIVGTERYGSINALRGLTQGRKDDLESLCYMLIYFFIGKLPWQGIKEENEIKKHEKLINGKRNFKIDNYKQIPQDFSALFKYVKNLKFEEEPKYSLMIKLLQKILSENNCFNNNCFYWIKNLNNCHAANIKRKKEGFRERLYEKIEKSSNVENINIFSGRKIKNIDDVDLENIGIGYIDEEDDLEDNENNNKYKTKSEFQLKIKRSFSFDKSKKENKEEEDEDEDEKKDNENKENNLNASNSSINTKVYKLAGPLEYFVKKELTDDIELKDIKEIHNKKLEKLSQKESKNKEIIISKKSNNLINEIIREEPLNEDEDEKISHENNCEINEKKEYIYSSVDKNKGKFSGISNNMKQESTKESIQFNYKDSDMKGNCEQGSIILVKNDENKIENKVGNNINVINKIEKVEKNINTINKNNIIRVENNTNNSKIIITKKSENKFEQIKKDIIMKNRSKSLNTNGKKTKKQKNKDCITF